SFSDLSRYTPVLASQCRPRDGPHGRTHHGSCCASNRRGTRPVAIAVAGCRARPLGRHRQLSPLGTHAPAGARVTRGAKLRGGGAAEGVVVDNHSPRNPVIPWLRRLPGVSLRRWGRNFGFARAVNEGCRLARGQWLLLLNPDVRVPPGFLDTVRDRIARLEAD